MAQEDLVISNQSFPNFRADLNANLQALGGLMSGGSAPSTTYAYMWWADTTNGVLKQRDAANAAWVIRSTLSNDRVQTKTGAYTVVSADFDKTIQCDASGGAFTVTLPAAATVGDGFIVTLQKTDATAAGIITIDGNASETIEGALTTNLMEQYGSVTLICDGSSWTTIRDRKSVTGLEATLASATTTNLGSALTNLIAISGTTTITGFGSSASIFNPLYFIRFTGALTLTYNATSMILPNAADITTAAGDTAVAQYLGSGNWRIRDYTYATTPSPTVLGNNILVNGSLDIWQNGTSFTVASGVVTYTADQWCVKRAATGCTVTRQAGDLGRYSMKVQRDSGNASTVAIYMVQPIETPRCYELRGKFASFRMRAKCGANYSHASSGLEVYLATGTGTDENLHAGLTGQATGILSTITLTTSWQDFTLVSASALPTNMTDLGLRFGFTPVGTAGADDSYQIELISINSGTTANLFQHLPQSEVLSQCERFFEKSFLLATAPAQNAGVSGAVWNPQYAGASLSLTYGHRYRTVKRSAPTVTIYNPSAANAQIRNVTAGTDWTSTSVSQTYEDAFVLSGTSPAGSSAGANSIFHFSADSRL